MHRAPSTRAHARSARRARIIFTAVPADGCFLRAAVIEARFEMRQDAEWSWCARSCAAILRSHWPQRGSVNAMEIKILRDRADFRTMRAPWEALAERSPGADLFNSFDWLDAWWSAFRGEGEDLRIYCLVDEERMIAAAPLMRSPIRLDRFDLRELPLPGLFQRGVPHLLRWAEIPWSRVAGERRMRSMFNHYSGRTNFLFDPQENDALPQLLRGLLDTRDEWDALELPWVPEDSPLFEALEHGAGAELRVLAVRSSESPYIEIRDRTFESYYLEQFSAKTRSRDRSTLRDARAQGGFELERIETGPRVQEAVAIVMEIEARGWKGERGSAMGQDERVRTFVHDISDRLSAKQSLCLLLLHLKGRPAAFVLGFTHRGVFYYFKTSYDPEFQELRPGRIVTNRAIEEAFDRKLRRFDFLGAKDEYKMRYTPDARAHATVFLYHDGLRSRIHRAVKRNAIPLAKKVLKRGTEYSLRVDR